VTGAKRVLASIGLSASMGTLFAQAMRTPDGMLWAGTTLTLRAVATNASGTPLALSNNAQLRVGQIVRWQWEYESPPYLTAPSEGWFTILARNKGNGVDALRLKRLFSISYSLSDAPTTEYMPTLSNTPPPHINHHNNELNDDNPTTTQNSAPPTNDATTPQNHNHPPEAHSPTPHKTPPTTTPVNPPDHTPHPLSRSEPTDTDATPPPTPPAPPAHPTHPPATPTPPAHSLANPLPDDACDP
jgi:hypothetical protein